MENIKLTLPPEWIGRIMQILAKQPYDQVADVIDGMKAQVSQHMIERQGARQGVQAGNIGNGAEPPVPPPVTPPTVQ